ncbi:MAG: prepilin peptidase [Paracoccaceae bacterium]
MTYWALILLILTLPVSLLIVYYDVRYMRIPNKLVLLTALIFLATGPFLFTFQDYIIRASLGLFMLILGFLLHLTGRVPGGDIKYAAALLPYIAIAHLVEFLLILAVMGILGVLLHRSVKWIGLAPADWVSWQRPGAFPYGLSLAMALLFYLIRTAFIAAG